jgi:hypothetical protein
MQEETIGFFIILVPFFIAAGFDAMTALLVILLGTTTGFAFSIVNPFSVGAAYDAVDVLTVPLTNIAGQVAGYYDGYAVVEMASAQLAPANAGVKIVLDDGTDYLMTANTFIVNADYFSATTGTGFLMDMDPDTFGLQVPMFYAEPSIGEGLIFRSIL